MNEQDKAAFEEWWTTANVRLTDIPKSQAVYIYESMLAHRDKQAAQAEPVAKVVFDQKWIDGVLLSKSRPQIFKVAGDEFLMTLDPNTPLYTHPPAEVVNEPDPSKCFNAAINYTLKCGIGDGGLEFLACWREGNFDAIRKEWPDAPSEVFEGAEAAIAAAEAAKKGGVMKISMTQCGGSLTAHEIQVDFEGGASMQFTVSGTETALEVYKSIVFAYEKGQEDEANFNTKRRMEQEAKKERSIKEIEKLRGRE